jgi:glycosyltransferase involved in cell wall biosynthesis
VILEAFARAFRPDDDVELRMVCDNPWSGPDGERWRAACRASPMAPRITVLPRVAGFDALASLMGDADCGVFPARGEAWNLEVLEMMSCGRPVIVTEYAGHTEYVDQSNALLVEIDALEPAADLEWNTVFTERKTGEWAHLGERQIDQLVTHLRDVHARKQAGEVLRNDAGVATAEQYSWARTAERLVDGFSWAIIG